MKFHNCVYANNRKTSNHIFKASDKDKDGLVTWEESAVNEFEDLSGYGDSIGK